MPTPRKHANHAQRQRAYVLRQKEARLEAMAAKNTPAPAAIPTVPSTARWKALSRQAQTILQALQTEMEDFGTNAPRSGRKAKKEKHSNKPSNVWPKPSRAQ